MKPEKLLEMLHTAEKLKNITRHCDTSTGRRESVAEHSWRLALMSYWIAEEFPNLDTTKIMKMCLIHDLGECFTGDIPVFDKTDADEEKEEALLQQWIETIPEKLREEMSNLFLEMKEQKTEEAKVFKALDGMEAILQHNEADISTWEDHEYDLQLTYCCDRVTFSPYLESIRNTIKSETIEKIQKERN